MDVLASVIEQLNLDPNILIFVILLPLVVTIICFAKYIVGVKSLGIYVPVALTFMFYELGQNNGAMSSDFLIGLRNGIVLTLFIFLSSAISYSLISKWSLHYYSKVALVTSAVAIFIIGVFIIFDLLGLENLIQLNVFSLILMVSVTERYMNLLTFRNKKTTILLSLETIVLAILCYFLISLKPLYNLVLDYPLLVLIIFPINYYIGKFTGLRLSEYYRFREILSSEE